ncbi:type IV secretion system DNA-binding domain-containing protein [Dactylosporangium sp. NPDC049140]|uniref:type IV secretory system conjugative DNA transfer family protein n=1 Tax=Dactylosporangium sp. NPDC049140 TaxID=3155647 RepID=UPI0033FE3DC6
MPPTPAPSRSVDPTTVPAVPHSHLLDLIQTAAGWTAHRPWLAAVAAALIVAAVVTTARVRTLRHQRFARHAQQVLITPPPQVDPAGATAWWANLYELLAPSRWRRLIYGTPHVAMEYRWTGRALTIQVWLPGTVPAGPVAAAVRAAWPGASATITEATDPVPVPSTGNRVLDVGGALAPALPTWYPLQTDHDTDPTRALVAAGAGLSSGERACVQILARPAAPRRVQQARRAAAALRTGRPPSSVLDPAAWLRGGLHLVTELITPARTYTARGGGSGRSVTADPIRDHDARPGLDKTLQPQWETGIRYAVAAPPSRGTGRSSTPDTNPQAADSEVIRRRLATAAHALASSYGIYTGRNRLRRRNLAHPAAVLAQRRFTRGFLLCADELTTLAALPTDVAVPGLDRARAKAVPAPVTVPTGGRGTKVLGRAEVGGHSVALRVADAREHIHMLGATGSGKSTEMTHMVIDDVNAHRGVVVIDPKGDLAQDILDRLPASVADRLVLIDPDQERGATLNPLTGGDDDLVVDNIVSIFSKIFQRHWGPRIDDVLRVACLTLMRKANATLTLVPPLLNDKQFRAAFTVDLDDPEGLKGFWEWYEATPPPLRAQVIGPVLARLRAFLLRDFVRDTIGVATSSFDMATVLDGGILIARLPKGQLGEETAKLMGSLILASVWQAATARARIPEDRRRDASVYIDEAHNVLNLAGSVGDMLAEARGYHLSLILAHQNLSQLPRDTQLALSANARNKVYFNCSPEDAHQLARHTLPELDEHDLSHLDAYTTASRLVVANRETAAFTMLTRPPLPILGETTALRQAVARTDTGEPTGVEQLARRPRGKRTARRAA